MAYIIGAGTNVTGFGIGIQGVNYQDSPSIQRLWQLGSGVPFDRSITRQPTLSVTRYAGGNSDVYDMSANIDCNESAPITIAIIAPNCNTGNAVSITREYWVTSFSYQKDFTDNGLETWNFIARPIIEGANDIIARMIRGVAEGQQSVDGILNTGIVFYVGTVPSESLEVSYASSPSIGTYDSITFGEIQEVGGTTTGKKDGHRGNSTANASYVPLFLPL